VVLALIGLIQHCKAHPDEKGIETPSGSNREHGTGQIAKLIPTKRELKLGKIYLHSALSY